MRQLLVPGTAVEVTDDSFYIPASSGSIALFFISTASRKRTATGELALGTCEHTTVNVVTGISDSVRRYGVPRFITTSDGLPHHGDARNEYGLQALNDYLGVSSYAYVVRSNLNINDDREYVGNLWKEYAYDEDTFPLSAAQIVESDVNKYLNDWNRNFVPAEAPYDLDAEVDFDQYPVQIRVELTGGEIDGQAAQISDLVDALSSSQIVHARRKVPGNPTTFTLGESTISTAASVWGEIATEAQSITQFINYLPMVARASALSTDVNDWFYPIINNDYDSDTVYGITLDNNVTLQLTYRTVVEYTNALQRFMNDFELVIGDQEEEEDLTIVSFDFDVTSLLPANDPTQTDDRTTVTREELIDIATNAFDVVLGTTFVEVTSGIVKQYWEEPAFGPLREIFFSDLSDTPMDVFGAGFSSPATDEFWGLTGHILHDDSFPDLFTAEEAREAVEDIARLFPYVIEFVRKTSLGSTDAERRSRIVEAMIQTIKNCENIRSEDYEVDFIVVPGLWEKEVNAEVEELLNHKFYEAIAIPAAPMNLDPNKFIDWAGSDENRFWSQHFAYYYPAAATTSNLDGRQIVACMSGVILRMMVLSDNRGYKWSAPAGNRRGVLTKINSVGYISGELGGPTTFNRVHVTPGMAGVMYSTLAINPILNRTGVGIVVNGQRTSTKITSALDRINVVRGIADTRRALRKLGDNYVFEPNVERVRTDFQTKANNFLAERVTLECYYDFATLCDLSNNTPERIDRNEMWLDVAVKPVKTAEFIYIPIRVVNTGTDI